MSENYEHDTNDATESEPDWFETNVIPFPARPSWIGEDGNPTQEWVEDYDRRHGITVTAVGDRVVEGVIVDRADATPATWKAWRATRRSYRAALKVLRFLLAHRATRFGARQAAYLLSGVRISVRRTWESRTTTRHEQMMRAATAAGDHVSALEWAKQADQFRAARHARRMELLGFPARAAAGIAHGLAASVLVLGVVGIALAVSSHHAGQVATPFMVAFYSIRDVVGFINAVWRPVLTAAPFAALAGAWAVGRNRAELPMWLAAAGALPAGPDTAFITPSAVVIALRDLGISALRQAIREMADGAAAMLGPIRTAGVGVEVDVQLPSGVPTTEVAARHQKLAENLSRHRHELYITVPAELRRTVRLWIADIGALDEPIGPSPLVTDPEMGVNWFTGSAPWGVDLRRDAVGFRPYQRHVLVTGLSNHGKTVTMRTPALWAALDPCVEFRIADLKGVGDWGMFDGLATVLIQGPTDAHVIAATEMAEEMCEEMDRRLMALQDLDAKNGVEEKLARRSGSGFHPILGIFDEVQVAIMCPAKDAKGAPYGGFKNASRFFNALRRIENQGRAVNITVWLGTQDPNPQNFPVMLRNGAHVRASLPLGSEGQSKMVLGEDAVTAGAAPHKLRRGIDKGVVVVTGEGVNFPTGQAHMTVWTHFVDGDAAHQIADRAKTRRAALTSRTGQRDGQTGELPPLDVLADIAAILGDAVRLPKQEAMLRLAERDDRYRDWTDARLKAALEDAGAPQYTYNGVTHVHGDRVRDALARRFSATD